MTKSMEVFFQDPIILAASLVLVATVIILIWALKTFRTIEPSYENEVPYDDEPESKQPFDNSGISEACLQEIRSQLNGIDSRLDNMEKALSEKNSHDETVQMQSGNGISSSDMEKFVQRIDSRLELLSTEKPSASGASSGAGIKPDDLDRIESKLDAVRKLLVLLADGGGSGV